MISVAPQRESGQDLPSAVTIAIDTEYVGPHTVTVQIAARLDEETLAIQVYRSAAVPDLPADFCQEKYLPLTQAGYGRFCSRIILRPVKLLTSDLSPSRMLRDLLDLPELDVRSRSEGRHLIACFGLPNLPQPVAVPANVRRDARSRRWRIPALNLTLVGHFLRADFGRIHGRDFLEGLKNPYWSDRARLVMRSRKVLQFVEQNTPRTSTNPVLEYACLGNRFFEVRVSMRDTMLPFGPASLDSLSKTFLGFGKSETLTANDKADMLRIFQQRTADAYGYAAVDVVNTLLVYEEMQRRDREIYQAFGIPEGEAPSLRPTLGGRVSSFIIETAERLAAGAASLPSDRALKALMRKGGVGLFTEHPDVSRYGSQTGRAHGGLLYSRSGMRFWHASPGMLRDVDMAGCYNNILGGLSVYWGRPVIYEPGDKSMTLREAICLVLSNADRDGWMIRVSGELSGYPNALIPSTENAITSANYREKLRKGKRRQARQRAFHLEALRDPGSVKGTGGSKLYASRIEAGVVTWPTWLMIQALPPAVRKQYESLIADRIIFYPRVLAAHDGAEFDTLVERYRTEALPWAAELDLEQMQLVRTEKIDADYVTLKYPIGQFAQRIGQFRKEAQTQEGKGSGLDLAWKVHANSMYGVLASSYLMTNNFVAANLVTAQARAEAFALSQCLNSIQTITDGCTYRIDQIPFITYEECLKIMPDYPIRRAEDGDGIPFLDPKTVPQDDKGFTDWYRAHVKQFFGVGDPGYDQLFATHTLEHKKISKSKQVAFDALGCDGSGNYLKATQTCDGGWQVEDFAARSYGRRSKEAIQEWLVRTYSNDTLTELAPVAEDTELLAFTKAAQQARAVLKGGVEVAFFPLGLERRKVMNYRALKASGFLFNRPEQRAAIVKAWVKFEGKSGAGLEALALRRSYGGRRQGSLEDLAEELYRLIRNDEDNLTKLLNLNKLSQTVLSATSPRSTQIKQRKAEIDQAFWETIDATNLVPEALPTAYLVTAAEIELIKGDEDSLPLQTTPTDAGLASWPPWPGTEKVGAV